MKTFNTSLDIIAAILGTILLYIFGAIFFDPVALVKFSCWFGTLICSLVVICVVRIMTESYTQRRKL